ncbi:hypothetical protein ANO14919_134730 [Xylariales sp. No.14919]|nr:hypothetical protein ANO14919_134730 [Xylariales sp. No.14919]
MVGAAGHATWHGVVRIRCILKIGIRLSATPTLASVPEAGVGGVGIATSVEANVNGHLVVGLDELVEGTAALGLHEAALVLLGPERLRELLPHVCVLYSLRSSYCSPSVHTAPCPLPYGRSPQHSGSVIPVLSMIYECFETTERFSVLALARNWGVIY